MPRLSSGRRNAMKSLASFKLRRNNTSGFPGVSWHKRRGKWLAYIWWAGSQLHLGYFDTRKAASLECCAAKARLHRFAPAAKSNPDFIHVAAE